MVYQARCTGILNIDYGCFHVLTHQLRFNIEDVSKLIEIDEGFEENDGLWVLWFQSRERPVAMNLVIIDVPCLH